MAAEEKAAESSVALEFALQGMKSTADKLRAEIEEYERTHQTA